MGTTLVKSAYLVGQWKEINGREFRLLVHMALTAFDEADEEHPARRYWRGREAQALALGYTAADCHTRGAQSSVSKAIKKLVEAGLIDKLRGGHAGRSAEYELLLHGDFASADLLPKAVDQRRPGALPGLSDALPTEGSSP